MSTWAGFAGASDGPAPSEPRLEHLVGPELGERSEAARQLVARAAELDAATPDAATPDAATPDAARWPEWIEARLQALVPAGRGHGASGHDAWGGARLQADVDAALAGLDGRIAVEVRDLETGATLASTTPERLLNPASNQKLVTAIAAVELLGADYRFETTVARSGDALILRGEGDPDLHVRDLHALAARVAALVDLASIDRIIFDDAVFDGQTLGPGYRASGRGDSYMAPSAALAIDFGTIEISVAPGDYLGPAQVHVEPASAAIEVVNTARTAPGRLRISTRAGEAGQTIVEVSGAIVGGSRARSVRRRVADPSLHAAATFAELLATHAGATEVLPVVRGATPIGAALVARHESEPLVAVLSAALRYSNNFAAEQVLRTLAWRASGEPGSWVGGVKVLERFAAAVSPARGPRQTFVNGSGLTHDGRLSPAFVVDVLSLADRPGSPAQTLLASFAKAGGEGTLRTRVSWAGTQVMAKTGTYAGASTLSGIITDPSGVQRCGFSILVNGATIDRARLAQDRVVLALLRSLR